MDDTQTRTKYFAEELVDLNILWNLRIINVFLLLLLLIGT